MDNSGRVVIHSLGEWTNFRSLTRDALYLVWLGMGGNRHKAEALLPAFYEHLPKDVSWWMVMISEWEHNEQKNYPHTAYVTFDTSYVQQVYQDCHVVLAPQDVTVQPAKSGVKVLTAWLAGLPVIASNLPEYKETITHGIDG